MCVCERERERETVCVCVCVSERERASETVCVCERESARDSVCVAQSDPVLIVKHRERERERGGPVRRRFQAEVPNGSVCHLLEALRFRL